MNQNQDKIKADFGDNLRKIRNRKKYSLRKVSSKCDLDDSNISKIENGYFNVQLSTIIELGKGLDEHPIVLFDYDFGDKFPQSELAQLKEQVIQLSKYIEQMEAEYRNSIIGYSNTIKNLEDRLKKKDQEIEKLKSKK